MALRTTILFGFPLERRRFYYRGRRCRLHHHEIRYLKKLGALVNEATFGTHRSTGWLLSYRDFFRRTLENVSPAVLALVVGKTQNTTLKRLAIWLLGRQGGTLGSKAISRMSRDENVVLRREVARALARKSAWAELTKMRDCDTDDRVRALARQPGPTPHQKRLITFLDDVAPQKVPDRQMPLQVNVDVDAAPGRPPKTGQFIRLILEHIRALVRGHTV